MASRQTEQVNQSPNNEAPKRGSDLWPAMARPTADRNPPTDSPTSNTSHGTTECRYE